MTQGSLSLPFCGATMFNPWPPCHCRLGFSRRSGSGIPSLLPTFHCFQLNCKTCEWCAHSGGPGRKWNGFVNTWNFLCHPGRLDRGGYRSLSEQEMLAACIRMVVITVEKSSRIQEILRVAGTWWGIGCEGLGKGSNWVYISYLGHWRYERAFRKTDSWGEESLRGNHFKA